jgi:hypothetical protein
MVKQTKTKKVQSADEVPNPVIPEAVLEEQLTWSPGEGAVRFVVTRGGVRVSDKDYPTVDNDRAIAERDFWKRVVTNYPDGTKVEIVQYDKKKHRIW